MNKWNIGDYIEVVELISVQLKKKKRKPYRGEISFIGLDGLLYGTWGQFLLNPNVDKIKKIKN